MPKNTAVVGIAVLLVVWIVLLTVLGRLMGAFVVLAVVTGFRQLTAARADRVAHRRYVSYPARSRQG